MMSNAGATIGSYGNRLNLAVNDLVLVDQFDQVVGQGEKMAVHRSGQLHRAFSVFIFRPGGEMLLQKRAAVKYHSGGLWANSCCGHPVITDDNIAVAAQRRLQEEFGFSCSLHHFFNTVYRAAVGYDMVEHEYVHGFYGIVDAKPIPNSEEICMWRWITVEDMFCDMKNNQECYAPWFRHYVSDHGAAISEIVKMAR